MQGGGRMQFGGAGGGACGGKEHEKKPAMGLCLVCPPGLEPGPKASEAFMVSNSTTGT